MTTNTGSPATERRLPGGPARPPEERRGTATAVGVLFIIATVVYLVAGAIHAPATDPTDYLERAHPDRTVVTLGVLLEFACVLAIPMIGMLLYPVLRRWHGGLALAYAGFRSLEAVFLIAIQAKVLSLIDVSEDHLAATGRGEDGAAIEAVGDGILAEIDRLFTLYVLVFAVGGLFLYWLLHRSRLVPRWLADWGFLAAAWMLVGTIAVVLTDASGALIEAAIVLPLALNEMVLAGVLIIRGFGSAVGEAARRR